MQVKNNTLSVDTWCGQMIEPSAYYEIETVELSRWQNDSKVLQDIASGALVINNGISDISDVASAINSLKGIDSSPKDSDGAPLQRTKVTQSGWNYQVIGFEITTSTANGIVCNKADGSPLPFFSYKMFDVNGAETAVPADCVKTQVDFEPTFDYEILGGELRRVDASMENVFLHVVGVPDIPAQYGGSKSFVESINLKYIVADQPLSTDGRAPKRLVYSSSLHTNKLRFILRHNSGVQQSVFQIIELFRP